MDNSGILIKLYLCIICIKVLLYPSYHSTDFEVHRNWLAITHSLPISEWYKANHSEWTLDYPPLFALMEKVLSYPAILFDPQMLEVESLNYCSVMTKVFQRLSVILTDLVLLYAVFKFINQLQINEKAKPSNNIKLFHRQLFLFISILANFGLFIVDHIHFQYNGILFGILFLSFFCIYEQKILEGAFWFSILLCMKHIFLYISPVYVIYILKQCFIMPGKFKFTKLFSRLFSIGIVVILVFSAAFGPFILMGQFDQILSRLFPFKRGLCHAYWAPNFWPIYNVADKILLKFGSINGSENIATMTGGLVKNFEHSILPNILPTHTFALVLLSMIPALSDVWLSRKTNDDLFMRAVCSCALSSFMFGWHVHEKAILIVILPFTLLAMQSFKYSKLFFILSSVGNYSLFPLIFTPQETVIMYSLYVFSMSFSYYSICNINHQNTSNKGSKFPLNNFEIVILMPIFFIELYKQFLHERVFPAYQFLPLLIVSLYSSVVIFYVWIRLQVDHLSLLTIRKH